MTPYGAGPDWRPWPPGLSRGPIDQSTPPRAQLEHARHKVTRRDPLWPEQLVVLAVILLSLTLPHQLTIGPTWLVPAIEGVLFVALVVSTPRRPSGPEPPRRRQLRVGLISIMSAANVASLFLLADFTVKVKQVSPRALLWGGVVLWVTAVLLYALWYWELDRGGPLQRGTEAEPRVDLVFPQMQDDRWSPRDWLPGLPDFLYLSLINAATFGPPESHYPLTTIAKFIMSLQSLGALATDTLIVARAVNLLSSG
jgi:hypothetical protein